MNEIVEKVRAFLTRFFRTREIKDDENIFELGFVNSLFAMQLVMFLEKEFSIRIENSDLDMENFKSINHIREFIEKKKNKD